MENITLEQQNTLNTWTGQRGELLQELSLLRTEKETLQSENDTLTLSNSQIQSELESKTVELDTITTLITTKNSTVESELSLLDRELALKKQQVADVSIDVDYYETKRQKLIDEVKVLGETISNISDKYGSLAITVDKIMRINNNNIEKFDEVLKGAVERLSK